MITMRLLICFLLGSIASLSLPPFGILFVLPISFSLLLNFLLSSKSKKINFYYGFLFGFGYFFFSLNWIGNALMVEPDKFAWMKPLALIGIPAFLGLYIGAVAVISSLANQTKILAWWVFSITWTLAEVVRSYFVFPFPWNLLGYSFYSSNELSQLASIVGVYGLSLIAVSFSSVLVTRSIKAITFCIVATLGIYLFGYNKLSKSVEEHNEFISVRIVHPGKFSHHLGDQEKLINQINDLIKESNKPYKNTPDFIVWPEAVIPLDTRGDIAKALSEKLPRGASLLAGADRVVYDIDKSRYYNSVVSIDPSGQIKSIYDKNILVPFGEYIPMRWLFPSMMEKIAHGMGDFSSGEISNLLDVNHIRVLPLICYEAIFSFYIDSFNLKDSHFIINVTNDSWFGDSIGPKQHFYMSKFRAIEYGIYMVRVANGGISGLIDKNGIDVIKADGHRSLVLDVDIPKTIHKTTFYAKYLNILQAVFLLSSLLTYILIMLYSNKKR